MGKICAIKTCDSGRKNGKKKEDMRLSFFQATESSKRLETWSRCLGVNLKNSDYICELHFKKDEVKSCETINIRGNIHILPLFKKKLKEGAIPTLVCQYNVHAEPQQQIQNKDAKVQQAVMEQRNHSPMGIDAHVQQRNLNNWQQKAMLSMSDKESQQTQMDCDISIHDLKKNLRKVFMLPPFWSYSEKPKDLEFMRIDPATKQVKYHLRLNEDFSITVICTNNEEITLQKKITSLNDICTFLMSVEKWPVCVGIQIGSKKFSEQCKGVIILDESYQRMQMYPRCKACRILRNLLQTRKTTVNIASKKPIVYKSRAKNFMTRCKRLKTTVD